MKLVLPNILESTRLIRWLLLGLWPFLIAAEIPKELKDSLELQIINEVDKICNEFVNEEIVCRELGIQWPLSMPEKSKNALEQEIQKIIQMESEQKYPESLREDFELQARSRYRAFEIGDPVSFELKDGTEIDGYLRRKTKTEVLIDNLEIKLSSLDDEELAHFDKYIREVKMKELIRGKMAELNDKRVHYQRQIRDEVSRNLYKKSGYIMINRDWTPVKEFVEKIIDQRRDQFEERLRPMLKVKLYYENDLALFQNEWMSREEAREKQKILDEQQQAQAESAEQAVPEQEEKAQDVEEKPTGGGGLWD